MGQCSQLLFCWCVYCGVRQGGVFSPLLFNLYVDDLICRLELSNLGCCINGIYLGCIMYADDVLFVIIHGNLSMSYNIFAMNYHLHIYLIYTNGTF